MAHPQNMSGNAPYYHHQQQIHNEQYQQQQQAPHHHEGQDSFYHQQQHPDSHSQPFTLEQALPYTPFTSVLPFQPDIINNPTIGSGPLAPSVFPHVSHDDLDALNKEAGSSAHSRRLEGSLELVQNLLKPEKITEFQFKTAPKSSHAPASGGSKKLLDGLSPFTRMVLENTSVAFRYPDSGTATTNGQTMAPKLSKKPTPKARKQDGPKVVKHNPTGANSFPSQAKSRIEIHLPTRREVEAASLRHAPPKETSISNTINVAGPAQPQTVSLADLMVMPQQPLAKPPPQSPTPTVQRELKKEEATKDEEPVKPPEVSQNTLPKEIPEPVVKTEPEIVFQPLPPTAPEPMLPEPSFAPPKPAEFTVELPSVSFDKSQFVAVDDSADAPAHLSTKRRQPYRDIDDDDPLSGDLNQRELANVAFGELRRCLQDIYTARSHVMAQNGYPSNLITISSDQEPIMTAAAHRRVEAVIKKAIDLGCFRQAPLDDLLNIQALSYGAIRHAVNLDVKMEESWGEVEFQFWANQLADIELGLRAARTSLRVMCGGREERVLYSEDTMREAFDLFRNVLEGVIQPLAALRAADKSATLFRLCAANKKPLGTLLTAAQRLFALMVDLMRSVDLGDLINSLEYASFTLIFIGNASTEKDSAVGVQKFDALQSVAMNMISEIFMIKQDDDRLGIVMSILADIEKLPVNKQSARQFKLSSGENIMPVSALMMRLVQASASKMHNRKRGKSGGTDNSPGGDEDGLADDDDNDPSSGRNAHHEVQYVVQSEDFAAIQHGIAVQELKQLSLPLLEKAHNITAYVVSYIVSRALESSKSGETPYRNLLDLFVEDFARCLNLPDWPAAELFLRHLLIRMRQQSDGARNSAPARNMALELLGGMAAAIAKLRSHVRKIAGNFEGSDSDDLGRWLSDLAATVLDGRLAPDKALGWLGPYRVVLERLQDRVGDDQYLTNAISYIITDWSSQIEPGYQASSGEDSDEREFGQIAFRLRSMIEDPKWLSREYNFNSVTENHARLSYSIVLLRSQFCSHFNQIINLVLGSMVTDQATVRSKSLKSINQVLEEDPTILDGDSVVMNLIIQCSQDSSPQVRDSALGLIGKCISMRPHLEERMTGTVINRFTDSGVGVRKRAMKLAKDIYLGNQSKDVRSILASGLLPRMQDRDEGVRELARQMIEEIWISPFYAHRDDSSITFKQSLTDHVALIVQTSRQGNAAVVLDKVFQTILSPQSKYADANIKVCTRLVASMFDLVDNPDTDDPSIPSGKDALQVLMIFAKAEPKLFTFEQMRLLRPHIASLTGESLAVSRAVVTIYRRILPHIPSVHTQFLQDVRKDLMPAAPKVARTLLDDVVACLEIINNVVPSEHLIRLVSSSMVAIQKLRALTTRGPLDEQTIRKLDRYSLIVGMAGKHCNFDSQIDFFKAQFPKWQGNTVSKLMVDLLIPFTNPSQSLDVRKPALDAVGLVCQSNPRNYVSANVYTTFQQVFDEQSPSLESTVLRSFREFLYTEERRSEGGASTGANGKEGIKRDLKVMGSTSFDDVASATTQRFLKDITRIALASQDDHAFLATEVLATINRQGLVHPKETGVTFITLETCPVGRISEMAYQEHKGLHEKHETVIEREYAKTIQAIFHYQQDIIKDPRGATENPSFTPKLHLLAEVLKISKSKNRQKFLQKLVGQIDFDPSKIDGTHSMPSHVEFARFIIENLAFFEYVTIGELQLTVAAMEKLVTSTGSGIAQSIESEIFQVRMDPIANSFPPPTEGESMSVAPAQSSVDTVRLRQLCGGTVILSAVWEARSHLRRLYGTSATRREVKVKGQAKDLSKAPVKVQGVTGDKFWDEVERMMSSFGSQDGMLSQCRAFVELLNVDQEFKVADEDDSDLDAEADLRTPSGDEEEDDASPDNRGRKRKASGTPGGRKKRARSNSRPKARGRPRKNPVATDLPDADADGEWA